MVKDDLFDNILGATLSQAIFVPFTAVFITAFQFGWKIKLLFAVYFTLIENVFVYLGIFKKRWWRTTYTFLFLSIYFFISDKWWQWLKNNNQIVKVVSLFHIFNMVWVNAQYPLLMQGSLRYGIGKYHSKKEEIKVGPLYACYLAIVAT